MDDRLITIYMAEKWGLLIAAVPLSVGGGAGLAEFPSYTIIIYQHQMIFLCSEPQ